MVQRTNTSATTTCRPGHIFAKTNPELRYNLVSASIGGPIKKDKTQFFFNYEGRRQVPRVRYAPVPRLGLSVLLAGLIAMNLLMTALKSVADQHPQVQSELQSILDEYIASGKDLTDGSFSQELS
jgi:hypothetical protein